MDYLILIITLSSLLIIYTVYILIDDYKKEKYYNKNIYYITEWDKYESIISAAKINNLSDSHIAQCCNGKRKSCGGYKWKRIMEDKFNE